MGAMVKMFVDVGGLQIAVTLVAFWLLHRDLKRLERRVDEHDKGCRAKWRENWDQHRDMATAIARTEGRMSATTGDQA